MQINRFDELKFKLLHIYQESTDDFIEELDLTNEEFNASDIILGGIVCFLSSNLSSFLIDALDEDRPFYKGNKILLQHITEVLSHCEKFGKNFIDIVI